MPTINAQLLVDGVPYDVRINPFTFNTETRFTVAFNGSEDYVFVWDPSLGIYSAIGAEGADIPDNLEEAISRELINLIRKSQP
ncbi:MAG TPA: hypothetical protein VEZ17_16535 [Chitinophagaceae bacterium]|jgi:hypothetical protein|nr:hypothetical protein [Chitinophagaceae bacterium]